MAANIEDSVIEKLRGLPDAYMGKEFHRYRSSQKSLSCQSLGDISHPYHHTS